MKSIDDALELRGRIFGAFEMAEIERDPTRRAAWLTFVVVGGGPDRGRDGRPDRRARPAGAQAQLPRHRSRQRRASSSSRRARRLVADVPGRRSGARPNGLSGGSASRCTSRAWSPTWTTKGSTSRARRGARAGRGSDQGLGGRRAGVTASGRCWPRRRGPARPDGPGAGAARLLVAGPSRGVRRGRPHDPGRPARAWPRWPCSRAATPRVDRCGACAGGRGPRRPFRYRDLGTMATISRFRAVAGRAGAAGGSVGWCPGSSST